MKFQMYHENYNVSNLEKSLAFYEKALGLHEKRRIKPSTKIVAMTSGSTYAQ